MQAEVDQICNFVQVSDMLGTGGQPAAGQFEAIREAGYQVVINLSLATSTNAIPNEGEIVAALGMEYVHIPVVWEHPTLADLDRFFEAMERSQGRRVFAHCVMNMRVSVFVLLYRVVCQGVALEAARETMLRVWQPNPVWERFMEEALARFLQQGRCDGQRGAAGATPGRG